MADKITPEVAAGFAKLGISKEALAGEGIEVSSPPQQELSEIPYEYKRCDATFFQFIPKVLRVRPQWCVWKPVANPARRKPDKPPLDARTGLPAKSNDVRTWHEFDVAYTCYLKNPGIFGLGYQVHKDDPFTIIDADDVRDPVTSMLDELGQETMATLNSYCEASASLRGIRVPVIGKLPSGHRNRNGRSGRIEIYSERQFLIFTGLNINGVLEVFDRQAELESLYEREFRNLDGLKERPQAQEDEAQTEIFAKWRALPDERIIEVVCSREDARLLWTLGYPEGADRSAEDFKLLCRLSEFTGRDPGRMEKLFSLSKLARPAKWGKRRDYRERSIANAIAATEKVWEPEQAPVEANVNTAQETEQAPVVEDDADINALILADAGNAAVVMQKIGDHAMYCKSRKQWYFADSDARWKPDRTAAIFQKVEDVFRNRWWKVSTTMKPDDREWKHALRSLNYPAMACCVSVLQHQRKLAVLPEQLDSNPMLLGVKNGILDLAKGELVKPRLDLLVTKCADVVFDPDAKCPRWDGYLARSQPLADVRVFLRRFAGACFPGRQPEMCFLFCHGSGANGKSVFAHVLATILGDYYWRARKALLLIPTRANPEHANANDIADLEGKRLVTSSEQVEGRKWDLGFIKDFCGGGEKLHGRGLYKDAVNFRAVGKLLVSANSKPALDEFDEAITRRFAFVHWPVVIPENERIPIENYTAWLLEEASGILNWCLVGLQDLMARDWRMEPPDSIKNTTIAYISEEDRVRKFFDSDWFSPGIPLVGDEDPDAFTTRELRARYLAWSEERVAMPAKTFTAQCQRIFGGRAVPKRDRWVVILGLRMSTIGATEYAEYLARKEKSAEAKKDDD
jgi:putative DNA primase/helicase